MMENPFFIDRGDEMKAENEVRVLDVDVDSFLSLLKENGATYVDTYFQQRYVYDLKPKQTGKWLRLRTNGKETTLTIKHIESDKIDGTKELEIVVSDFDTTYSILKELGYQEKGYQENKRIHYLLDGVEIAIDSWPHIPTFVEFEGNSPSTVMDVVRKLGFDENQITTLDVDSIYRHYDYDLDSIYDLRFEEE